MIMLIMNFTFIHRRIGDMNTNVRTSESRILAGASRGRGRFWPASAVFASTALAVHLAAPAHGFEREPQPVAALRRLDEREAGDGSAILADSVRLASHHSALAIQDSPIPFRIEPGPLREALVQFERQSGFVVELGTTGIEELPTSGVAGLYTPTEALALLLDATPVTFESTGPRSIRLELRISEFVRVVASESARPASAKYTKPLRDIPQTIQLVPRALIEEQNATTLRDVLRNVTGISIQAGEGGVPAGDNLSIRGFNARTDIFVDGVRDFGGYARDSFNVEQVEVTKGPSSAFAGRGSTGGSVNLATKTPELRSFQEATLSIGDNDFKRATADLNFAFPDLDLEGTALRLNAMWTDSDVPGRDVVSGRRFGFAPSLALGLGTPTRASLSYSHLEQDNVPDYGIPWVPADNEPLADYANQAPPVEFTNFYGLRGRDYENTATDVSTADVEHAFSDALVFRNLLRWGRSDRDSVITAPRFVSSTSTDIRRDDWKSRDQVDGITANQTQLTAYFRTRELSHAVTTGLELSHETSENLGRDEVGTPPPAADLFYPNPNDPYRAAMVPNGALNSSDALSTAAYFFDTVDLDEHWQVTGGARWERFRLDYESLSSDGVPSPYGRADSMTSWRAGVVYKPRENGSIYFGSGTSFNPSSEGLILNDGTVDVEPETSASFELGTKWGLSRDRLQVTAALFRTDKTNARTPGLNPGDPPTVLEGKQRVDGLELGVTGEPMRGVTVFTGYTFMDSRITESNREDELGNELGNTPRHSFNLWSSYLFPSGIELGGGVRYVGDRYNNDRATRVAPGYWLLDAMAAYRVNENLTLRLNATNAANLRYIDRVGGGHFIPGDGRSLSVTAAFQF
jgi:catecholate siderophore receptor